MNYVRWTVSVPYIILSSWLSVCQKNYQIWWRFDEVDKNKLGHFLAHFVDY